MTSKEELLTNSGDSVYVPGDKVSGITYIFALIIALSESSSVEFRETMFTLKDPIENLLILSLRAIFSSMSLSWPYGISNTEL